MDNARTVLVTGAAGLIGQEVSQMLTAEGVTVIATDAVAPADSAVAIQVCDLRDVHGLYALAGQGVDAIVHCGGFSGPMHGADAPHTLAEVNIGGTANLLELARVTGVPRFVYASTATLYGETTAPLVTEDEPARPGGMYAASKAASEALVTAYRVQFGLDATSLRLSWVYGPRRTTACLIRQLLDAAIAGDPVSLEYGADFPRQYVHVADAARALVAATLIDGRIPRNAYNISGGEVATLDEVAQHVRDLFPSADIRLAPGPDPQDVRQDEFDISAAAHDLGYRPQIGLGPGIKDYADHLRPVHAAE